MDGHRSCLESAVMASSPYRVPAERAPTPREPRLLEMPILSGFLFMLTALRLVAGVASAEPVSRELVFAWVVLVASAVEIASSLRRER